MAVFIDDFSSDLGWSKVGSWVDSTYAISSGKMTLTAGAGGKNTSAYTRTGFEGLNASITVTTGSPNTGIPQIHLREDSSGNYLVVYIDYNDGTLNIGKVSSGTYTSFASTSSAIISTGAFTFTAKVFGNCLYGAVRSNDGSETIYKQLKYIGSEVSNYKGRFHGIGVTSGTQKYDEIDMRTLDKFTNVVCVGDSNVGADNRLYWPNLLMKRHFKEGFISENQGVSGQDTQYFITNFSTTVTPFVVTGTGVDNVLSIATGNNDFRLGVSVATTYSRQVSLMTSAKALGYRCELATLIPFVFSGDPLTFVTQLNTSIRDGYVTNGYTLCEIHNAFGAVNGSYGVNPPDLVNSDGIHYTTATGHPLAAAVHSHSLVRNYRNPVV